MLKLDTDSNTCKYTLSDMKISIDPSDLIVSAGNINSPSTFVSAANACLFNPFSHYVMNGVKVDMKMSLILESYLRTNIKVIAKEFMKSKGFNLIW